MYENSERHFHRGETVMLFYLTVYFPLFNRYVKEICDSMRAMPSHPSCTVGLCPFWAQKTAMFKWFNVRLRPDLPDNLSDFNTL